MKNIYTQNIIDAHHHLWDPTSNKYEWLTTSGHEVFNKIYLVDNYFKDFNELNIIKSVHIQAEINIPHAVYETEWIQGIGNSQSPLNTNSMPNAIIGFVDFLDHDVEKILVQHLKSANFRGIRQILNYDKKNNDQSHVSFNYLNDDNWIKNFSLLKKYDLSFDLSILYNQSQDAAKIINKEDSTQFIINHTLSPTNIENDGIENWLKNIKLLSSFDNVAIKLSGFGEFNSNWTEETIRPLILNVIDNFGVDRCMFGSNFPVDKFLSSSGYFDYWNAYFNIISDFTDNEKDKIFYQNAEKFYKI